MLFLQPQDYFVNKEGLLCINLNDFTLVFYTADRCDICKRIKKDYDNLQHIIKGCTFAMMNVDQEESRIRRIADNSTFKIDYVPLFVLHYNKRPVAQFDLKEESLFKSDLKNWLINVTSRILNENMSPQQPSYQQNQSQQSQRVRSSRDKKYKTFDDAYTT